MNNLMSSISVQVPRLLNKNHLSTKVKKLFADRVTVPKNNSKSFKQAVCVKLEHRVTPGYCTIRSNCQRTAKCCPNPLFAWPVDWGWR